MMVTYCNKRNADSPKLGRGIVRRVAQVWGAAIFVSIVAVSVVVAVAGCEPAGVEPVQPLQPPSDVNIIGPNTHPYMEVQFDTAEVNSTVPQPGPPVAPESNEPPVAIAESNAVDVNIADVNVTDVNTVATNDVQPKPTVTFHEVCAGLLKMYVDDKGMVNYRLLDHRKEEIRGVLKKFAELDRSLYNRWERADKMAFWINLYNIEMLWVIVDNYPIQSSRLYRLFWPADSIRHIAPQDAIGVKKWDRYKFIAMDEQFTLSEIEERFFRKEFADPRLFLATMHGTVSGPPLRNVPYRGKELSVQLDEQVRRFLQQPRVFRIDRANNVVYLSAMFEPSWYGKDFIGKYGTDKKFKSRPAATRAVLNFICNYLPAQDKAYLETADYTIRYVPYDWRLNDGSEKPR